ncbi:MAG: UDP binding domain-containing protein, partial [Candidatus Latescibacterota bacterium]
GLGEHCIPIDPFYLSWKAKLSGFEARFIELAGQINGSMPEFVVHKISAALNRFKKSVNGSRILILGISYKENIADMRESPALDVMRLLKARGADVVFYDSLVEGVTDELGADALIELTAQEVAACDCAAIITGHRNVDYQLVLDNIPVLVDTRNVLKGFRSDKIIKL